MNGVRTLVAHHWQRYRRPLVPMALGLALFEFLITRIAPAPDEVSWMTRMIAFVPPQVLAIAGADAGGFTPAGFVALGYAHPFFFLLLGAWAVRVSSGALAGEIGLGTMDLLASRPVARWQHVAAGALVVVGGLAVLVAAAWAGTAAGLTLRPLGVPIAGTWRAPAMAWLLFAAWGAVGLAIGATQRESGSAMGWTAGAMAVSFVVEYLARVWRTVAWLRPASLFAYDDPQRLARSGLAAADVLVLGLVVSAALAVAAATFARRDL